MEDMESTGPAGGFPVTAMMLYTSHLLHMLQSLLVRHLPCWGLVADCDVSLMTVSENATFIVTDAGGSRRILRFYRPGYHNDREILSELQWMQALEKTGIVRVPRIYPTVDGDLLVVFEEAGMRWRMACFEYLPGSRPSVDEALPEWFEKLGAITARLHAQSRNWQKPHGFCRKHWMYETMAGPQAYWGDWRKVRHLHPSACKVLERCDHLLKARTGRLSVQDEEYILLHGDLRSANLLIDGENLAAIDFDDCGFSWTALDFANTISFMEDHPLVPELQQAWLSGYETVTPPSEELMASIGLFVMLRRMQLTAWMATHA
jgi:Ser/Thr protein kinase RdoA (MazF antagonist)